MTRAFSTPGKTRRGEARIVKRLTDVRRTSDGFELEEEPSVNRKLPVLGACALVLLGSALSSEAASPIACNSLQDRTIAGATIATARLNAATATLPDHCEVLGKIDERQGID